MNFQIFKYFLLCINTSPNISIGNPRYKAISLSPSKKKKRNLTAEMNKYISHFSVQNDFCIIIYTTNNTILREERDLGKAKEKN